MQLSASQLGQLYGLTGEEMNRALQKLGFMKGTPGDYEPTDEGLPYIMTKSYHRGPGGYSQFNRDWITRSFDESIVDKLDVSDELIVEVKQEVADARAKRFATQAAARAKAEAEFLAKEAEKKATKLKEEAEAEFALKRSSNFRKAGNITLVIVVSAGIIYGAYKMAPHVKKWWNKRKQERNHNSGEELD